MENHPAELIVSITPFMEADEYELAELTQQLRQELLNIDVNGIEFAKEGDTPKHAKAIDAPVTWGTLLITLMASGGILSTLIHVIQDWLKQRRHEAQSVTLKLGENMLEIQGGSSGEQQQLINKWLEHVKTAANDD